MKKYIYIPILLLTLCVYPAESFIVHTIYFKPKDAAELDKPHLEDEIVEIVEDAQEWYAQELKRQEGVGEILCS